MVDRFFLPPGCDPRRGQVVLDPDESEHALRSRRLRVGDAVELFDGNGTVASGILVKASRAGCSIQIESATRVERDRPFTHLAVSVPRGPRMDSLVDACAQLGVVSITPIIFERSVAAREDVSPARFERWNRIAREAAKQSGEPFVVSISEIVNFNDFLTLPFDGRRILLHPLAGSPQLAAALPDLDTTIQIVVGPEGGVTETEANAALAAGLQIARLGRGLLRIEMAAEAACSIARLR